MKKLATLASNSILATTLLILVLAPIGIVARIGGTTPPPSVPAGRDGVALGARVNSLGESLAEVQKGEAKEVSFTTFWGQTATYQRALGIKNNHQTPKTYQIEVLNISGVDTEKQKVAASFQGNGSDQITLKPSEEAWIGLKVSAPPVQNRQQTGSTLKLVIWEHQ